MKYLPYISSENIKFGHIELISFEKAKDDFSKEIKNYLEWYFGKYIDQVGNKLDVTLVSYKSDFFNVCSEETLNRISDSIQALSALTLMNNNPLLPAAPDNFELFVKTFDPNNKSLALSRGGFVNVNKQFSSGVIDDITFVLPETTPKLKKLNYYISEKSKLFDGISVALKNNYNDDWFKRIIRSFRILNSAFRNLESFNYIDRILLLVISYETIFLDDTSDGKKLSSNVLKLLAFEETEEKFKKANNRIRSFTKKLYEVRSRFSHGQKVNSTKIINPVYGDLLKCGLYLYKLILKEILKERIFIKCDHNEEERLIKDFQLGLFTLIERTKES